MEEEVAGHGSTPIQVADQRTKASKVQAAQVHFQQVLRGRESLQWNVHKGDAEETEADECEAEKQDVRWLLFQ